MQRGSAKRALAVVALMGLVLFETGLAVGQPWAGRRISNETAIARTVSLSTQGIAEANAFEECVLGEDFPCSFDNEWTLRALGLVASVDFSPRLPACTKRAIATFSVGLDTSVKADRASRRRAQGAATLARRAKSRFVAARRAVKVCR